MIGVKNLTEIVAYLRNELDIKATQVDTRDDFLEIRQRIMLIFLM